MINTLNTKTMTASFTLLCISLMLNYVSAIQNGLRKLPCEDACAHGQHEKMSKNDGIAMAATFGAIIVIVVCCCCCFSCADQYDHRTTTRNGQQSTLNQSLINNGASSDAVTTEMTTPVASRQVSVDNKLHADIEADTGISPFNHRPNPYRD